MRRVNGAFEEIFVYSNSQKWIYNLLAVSMHVKRMKLASIRTDYTQYMLIYLLAVGLTRSSSISQFCPRGIFLVH